MEGLEILPMISRKF